ncbi:MAG TPA: efflux RND transporter periplasmic adaptor subunit [Candidatus Acidoferrales bacterium]|nr:efflux RND transporter periplasmic adaptor subunit [Candidatus Acidoferrales bacterium]
MRRSSRVWLFLAIALALVALLVWYGRRKPVPVVDVYTIAKGDISSEVSTNGRVEPITPYEMRSLVDSRVVKVGATEGQNVKQGQLIVALDDAAIQAQLSQARQQLVTSEDQLRIAKQGGSATQLAQIDSDIRKDELDRTKQHQNVTALEKLVAQQAATQQELTDARANLSRTEADLQRLHTQRTDAARTASVDTSRLSLAVQQAQDSVRDLEQKEKSTHIFAPISGTLYSLPVKMNDPVRPGDLLAAVADLKHIRVRAFVDEPELGGMEAGQTAIITWDALPNKSWTGKTGQPPKEVVARNTRSVGELLCTVDNSDQRLIPNINVGVKIELSQRSGVLVVPRSAVTFNGVHRYIYIVQGADPGSTTHLTQREVRVGTSSTTMFELVSGVREGESIALPGNVELKDGMRVRIAEAE